jgi:hypothetical protein
MKACNLLALFNLIFIVSACHAAGTANTITEISYDDGISLVFEEMPYNRESDVPTDCGNGFICLINNQPLWGADGKLPDTKLEKATVTVKKARIELDTSGMFNPLISTARKPHYQVIHYYGDTWKVRGRFSDGAGTYYAEWLVTKSGSMRIMIGDSELLYDAFDSIFGNK